MRRGLQAKLVFVLLLLIVSLMVVVSAFLIRGVMQFYLGGFYQQMQEVFGNAAFVSDLREAAAGPGGETRMAEVMSAYSGSLGIDAGVRSFYILSGETGKLLASGDGSKEELELTPNIVTALAGSEGYASDANAAYMDVAIPISSGDHRYVVYVRDNKTTVTALTEQLFTIILEALLVGLIISVLLAILLSKTLVVPIQGLTRAAGRMAIGDFSEKIPVTAKDEIGVLTDTFNDMASRLHDTLLVIENERNKLATVFLHMTDGIVAFSGDGAVIQFNPAAERFLDVDLEDADLRFDGVFGGIAPLSKVLSMGPEEVIEGEKQSGTRSLDVFLARFHGEGAQGGILAVVHDVTEQRHSDEMRREFVANVSHELRTPITNVRSYAETLVDSAGELPPETEKKFLNVILGESDRMTKIVQDLLALSRFDAGEMQFSMAPFDLTESAVSVYEAMRLDVEKHGIDLHLALPGEHLRVYGDRARIEQVIINIMTNAVRYTPTGGSVTMELEQTGNMAEVRVRDTGIGIPEADLPHIFDRFYRVDKARSRAMGGTGLGLSIAYEIVKRHDGLIRIESKVGEGTVVHICLPRLKEQEQ
jgi:two-component system sensor histidine kinase VicK